MYLLYFLCAEGNYYMKFTLVDFTDSSATVLIPSRCIKMYTLLLWLQLKWKWMTVPSWDIDLSPWGWRTSLNMQSFFYKLFIRKCEARLLHGKRVKMGCSVITGYKKGHFMRRTSWRNALCRVESIKSVGRFIIKQTKCTVRQGCWQLRPLNVAKSEWVTGTSSLSLLGIKKWEKNPPTPICHSR